MRMKEKSWKTGLKLNIQNPKIIASGSITLWLIDGEKVETVVGIIFLGFKITEDSGCSHKIRRCFLRREAIQILVGKMMSRFVIDFLPRSKRLLISWLQSPSAVILEPKKIKSVPASIFFPIFHQVMGLDAMILVFWMLSFKPTFSLFSFILIKRLFSSSLLSAIRIV